AVRTFSGPLPDQRARGPTAARFRRNQNATAPHTSPASAAYVPGSGIADTVKLSKVASAGNGPELEDRLLSVTSNPTCPLRYVESISSTVTSGVSRSLNA